MNLSNRHASAPIARALHLKVLDQSFANPDEAAPILGIKAIGERWRAIDRDTASRVLVVLLKENQHDQSVRMAENEALAATGEFLSEFSEDAQFYTNGTWEDAQILWRFGVGPQFFSATEAVVDGGILALGPNRSGILWIEDEVVL